MPRRLLEWKRWSFKKKLMLYSLLISLLPVVLLGMGSAYLAGKSVQEEVDRNHRIILKQVEYQMDNILKNLETFSLQIASDRTIEKSVERGISLDDLETLETTLAMKELIRQYRSYNGAPFDVSLVYDQHDQVYSNHYGLLSFTEFPYYEFLQKEQAQHSGLLVVPPFTYPDQKEFLMMRPVLSGSTPYKGRLILHVDPSIFYNVFQSANLGSGRKLLVIDDQGRVAVSSNKEEIGTRLNVTNDLYHYWRQPSSFQGTYAFNGNDYQLSYQKSALNGWTYIAMTPTRELTAKSASIRWLTWQMVVAISLVWLLISIIGSSKLYIPIQALLAKLSGASTDRSEGDLKQLSSYIDKMIYHNTKLQIQWKEQLPQLRESALLQLLRGEINDREFASLTASYPISLPGNRFYVCIIEVDQAIAFRKKYRFRDRTLIMYAFSKLVQEINQEMSCCETVALIPGQVICILGVEDDSPAIRRRVIENNERIRSKAFEYLGFTVTAAVSDSQPSRSMISAGYEQAILLQRYRLLMGSDVTITRESVEGSARNRYFIRDFLEWHQAIIQSLAIGDVNLASQQFNQMMEEAPRFLVTVDSQLGLMTYLLGDIEQTLHERGYELKEWIEGDLYASLHAAASMEEVREWFEMELFPAISRQLTVDKSMQQQQLIRKVTDYIHENFESELSLQQIADHFECSPYQLSRMFKEQMQINFVDYLIQYRIDKAKEWLVHSDLSIKDITAKLSYTTTQNFSRVFKQITGIPPGKYRERYRQS
ncbi:helix-turn-helix domain-containing protein [Paenibacillus senegalensis]|uniref:helix-turn-helix domain-containing protein n=1 Tax=Paenibacillus senegalensis TaxID=1465766 RepID=UPI000288696C|nr:helix-turn-helix domain-containing protein [Paenibacillus senegalensis]